MAYEAATSSGAITATTQVTNKQSMLHGIMVNVAGGLCTITIYDNASAASGLVLASVNVESGTTTQYISFPTAIVANNGLHVVIAGTAPDACIIHYSLQ